MGCSSSTPCRSERRARSWRWECTLNHTQPLQHAHDASIPPPPPMLHTHGVTGNWQRVISNAAAPGSRRRPGGCSSASPRSVGPHHRRRSLALCHTFSWRGNGVMGGWWSTVGDAATLPGGSGMRWDSSPSAYPLACSSSILPAGGRVRHCRNHLRDWTWWDNDAHSRPSGAGAIYRFCYT